jgi:ketosteroid isomerase-like protein
MTTNAERARVLERALRARVEGDRDAARQLYTDDVKAWAPSLSTSSREELLAELDRRDDAFSDLELDVTPLDVGGDFACAEWTVTMTHSGPFATADATLDATGRRVTVHGVTIAEFEDDRICSLRQYWDEFAFAEQLGLDRPGTDA